MIMLVYCILSLFNCMIFVFSPGPMWYISYFYGMMLPICADSAVKHQLTLRFSGHLPGEPGLAGVHWSKKMMEVVTAGAISRAKLQSNHHHQKTNIHFLQAGCPSCRPTNSVKALKGKYHIPWTCLLVTQAHLGVFQLCLWPLIAPGYLGGWLPCLSSALWYQ